MNCISLGHVSWGIAWYINGLLIPEIHVERGQTYTFIVEGGNKTGKYSTDAVLDEII